MFLRTGDHRCHYAALTNNHILLTIHVQVHREESDAPFFKASKYFERFLPPSGENIGGKQLKQILLPNKFYLVVLIT